MTEEKMDERLRAAGQRWRAANAAVADVPDESDGEIEILVAPKRHRQRWITAASAAVVAAALVAGGIVFGTFRGGNGHGRPATTGATALSGQHWTLSGDPSSTLSFTADSVAVDVAGCVKYTAATTVDGNHLTLGKQIGNGIACAGPAPGAATEHLNRVASILTGTLTWSVTGERLTLTKSDGSTIGTLVYTASQPTNVTLVETTWQLIKVVDREGYPSTVGGRATLNISGEQKLTGNDGCNALFGDVQVRSDTVNVGRLGTTEMACTDKDVTTTASLVDAILSGEVSYAIDGDELTLTNTHAGTLTYRAAKADVPITDPAQLTGIDWTLTGTEHDSGSGNSQSGSGASATGLSTVVFDGGGGFTVQHHCYTNKGSADLGSGTAKLADVTLKVAIPCASNAETTEGQHENDLVDGVLTGDVTWSITGKELTITKGGDRLSFERAGSTPPAEPSPTTDPQALIGPTWKLTTIERGTGPDGTSSTPSAAWPIIFNSSGGVRDDSDDAAGATVEPGRIVFGTRWSNGLVLSPGGHPLDVADSNFVMDKVLIGTVTWSITGTTLTMTKDGVGALVFKKR